MAREISDELKEIINGSSGKPVGIVNLYATNFTYPSDGFIAEYFNVTGHGFDFIGRDYRSGGRLSIDKYPSGEYISGIPLKDYNGDSFQFPENKLSFNWGMSPPLGINPYDLKDQRRWGVRWTGYFYFDKPGIYQFGIISTSLAQVTVGGQLLASGISSNKILSGLDPTDASKNRTVRVQKAGFMPIVVTFVKWNYDITNNTITNERDQDQERFTALWKSTEDSEWKILDCSRVVQNYRVTPVSGKLIDRIDIDISSTMNESTSTSSIDPDEFPVELKADSGYITKDGILLDKDISPLVTSVFGSNMIIYLNKDRKDGDSASLNSPAFLEPLVSVNGLPRVVEISENHSSKSASTASFSVDVTYEDFDEDNIFVDNCYTYNDTTESFGVLRKGRLVDIKLGYRTTVNEGAIQRFRGIIDRVQVSHGSDGANKLDVDCIDLSKHISDVQDKELPDLVSYDVTNLFNSSPLIDGDIRPNTYDSWRVVDVVRDIAYRCGITTEQLFAKDINSNYLIEDAGDRLMRGITYPFERRTVPGGELSSPYLFQVEYGDNLWSKLQSLSESFGRRLYFNMDGNLVLARPNNPKVVANYWTESSTGVEKNDPDWIEAPYTVKYTALRALRGFHYNTGSLSISLNFQGVGVALVLIRRKNDSSMKAYLGKRRSSDDTDVTARRLIDGNNILDTSTGHTGSIEYTAMLDPSGSYPLALDLLGDETVFEGSNVWYYKYGNHPRLGYNPSIIRICDNLTYGNYQLSIYGEEALAIEGFLVFKSNVYGSVRNLTGENGILSVNINEDNDSIRNSITVIGATIGGGDRIEVTNRGETSVSRVNNTIISKAMDIGSIKNPSLPNYTGREKSITIINPSIRDKSRADFLAQYILRRYKRNQRNPSISLTGSPDLELFDCVTIDDPQTGLQPPVALLTSGRKDIFRENPDPTSRFWVNSIQSSIDSTGGYTTNIQTTALEPQPAYEPLPDPPEEQFSNRKFFDNLKVSIDGSTSSIFYNAYEEDTTGKYVKIEFDQIFNARRMWVKIRSAQSYNFKERNLDNSYTNQIIPANQDLYTLMFQEGLIPHQHHTYYWNGWWEQENSGGSQNGGKYVPNTVKVYVEIYMERYSNGRAGTMTSLDTSTSNKGLSYIEMQNTDTGLYQGNIMTVNYEPSQFIGGTVNGTYPHYFDDSNTTYYGSLKTTINTNRPGGLFLNAAVYNFTYFSAVDAVNSWILRTVEKYIYPITGSLKEIDVKDKGDRIFFINPNNLVVTGNKSGIVPTPNYYRVDEIVGTIAYGNARKFINEYKNKENKLTSDGIQLYFEYYARPVNFYPTLHVFKVWLIRIPGAGQPESDTLGLALIDKDMNVFTETASDTWIQWKTSTTLYPEETLTTDTYTDQFTGAKGDLTISLSNIQAQKIQ